MTTERHGLLLVSWPAGSTDDLLRKIGGCIHEAAVGVGGTAADWWVGVGRPTDLEHVPATHSGARRAAHVAGALRSLGSVVTVDELGIYGVLSEVPEDRLRSALDPRYVQLADHNGHDSVLIDTLEMYLDNAGSVQATSKDLHIERASLYYRLRRIQEIAGIDLTDGRDRLSVHCSLKVARLIGLRSAGN
nr:helix-turn-helix domain-containing protein [Kribbella solani]